MKANVKQSPPPPPPQETHSDIHKEKTHNFSDLSSNLGKPKRLIKITLRLSVNTGRKHLRLKYYFVFSCKLFAWRGN